MSTAPPTTLAPTTAAPTTLAPTTLATTAAPTTTATTAAPTTTATTAPPTTAPPTTLAPTTVAPTNITCDPIIIEVRISCYWSYFPAAPRDTTLDAAYDLSDEPIVIEITLAGEHLNEWITCDPIVVEIVPSDDFGLLIGVVVECDAIEIEITLHSYGYVIEGRRRNWVKWSHVGYLNFEIDESNVAGERPLDWPGWVYDIRKLADKIVIYGENGVTFFVPRDVSFGMQTLHRIGLKGKNAVTGTDFEHFFINNLGELYRLADGLEKLDYSEYLSQMTDPVLAFDPEKQLVYICDGTYGYIYSARTGSLGEGPANVTGIGAQSGTLYVTAPTTIVTPTLEICTDIYDLETRKSKTIQSIEIGTDLTEHLEVSVDYRISNRDNFRQIGWHLVNPDGRSYPVCYGVEFRFRIRSFIYEYLEIDFVKIRGVIHNHSWLDSLSGRRQPM